MNIENSSFLPCYQIFLSFVTVKRFAVCAILLAMPIRSSAVPSTARAIRTTSLADQPQVRDALDWLDHNLDWTTAQQIRLTEIPAPSFQEEKRAQAVKEILSADGLSVFTDTVGNVIGELRG